MNPAPTVSRPPRDKSDQGQWASGHLEPLNAVEALKQADGGLSVRARVESLFAHTGVSAIPDDDLRERLKWWGLYTQRREGFDALATQRLTPADLAGEHFMLRIRIEGGLLTTEQLRAIALVSREHGRGIADVTDRQNVQLHWIRIEDMPGIWERLEAVGLTTSMACGDVPRGFLGCPVAGLAADEVIDATRVLQATALRAVGNPEHENLPRKFKTSIAGCAQHCAQPDVNDIAFVGVRGHDGVAGFDLWVGGGLGSNPHFAQRLGAFVAEDAVPDVWDAVARLYRDHGYRKSRKHARLKFLMADWGPERLRAVLEEQYLGAALPDGPAPAPSRSSQADHVGVFDQADGNAYVGFAPRAGRVSSDGLDAIADLADRYGSGRIRFTTQQKGVLPDIAPGDVEAVVDVLHAHELRVRASPFRSGMMACTGIEFCKLALAETKGRASWLYTELDRRLPEWDEPLRINVNGCPNSCARFQIADIGLMGALVDGPDDTRVEGFLVHLGGQLGPDRAFGAKVRGVRLPADAVADYVESLLRRYLAARQPGDTFSSHVRSLEPEALASFAAVDGG